MEGYHEKNILVMLMACGLLMTACLTGCGEEESKSEVNNETVSVGHITLKVNPKIRISYNDKGLVTQVDGKNDDGDKIVANLEKYDGNDCHDVISELVKEIHNAGYFVDDIEGEDKQIVIEFEPGSKIPDDDFVDDINEEVTETVDDLKLKSDVIMVDDEDDVDDIYNSDDKDDVTDKKETTPPAIKIDVDDDDDYDNDYDDDYDDGDD